MELREFRAVLPSTQTEAIRRARAGAPEGTCVVARAQSDGRGRLDHTWASPPGGLYLSAVFRTPTFRSSLLSLAVGARLRSAFDSEFGVSSSLKWPNDLLVPSPGRPRKLAGILVDQVPSPTLGSACVIGLGVNVASPNDSFPSELRDRVAALADFLTPPPSLEKVEEVAVAATRSAVRALDSTTGGEAILAECREALHGVGRRASVDATRYGIIRTLGDEGELWLDAPTGPFAVFAGDVVVEEP
ncbi:MAG: biotin--[acetyl-CoA-carboxylase] ligase [Thermoplasmata archaeon]|nr:biotin--[acetyl-CoA-carboxylase] ligase [Thermoplasmata archaeon]